MKRYTIHTLLLFIVVLCSSFIAAKDNSVIGKWRFDQIRVYTTPRDVILEEQLTEKMRSNYKQHYLQFQQDGEFVIHMPTYSSAGKYLIIDNRIALNDSVIKYGLDLFLANSMMFKADKNLFTLQVSQDKEIVQGINLTYGANLEEVMVNIIYKKVK